MNYGRAIRILCAAREMSHGELADRASMDPGFLSRTLIPGMSPNVKTIERIAAALQTPLWLLVLLASDAEDVDERAAATLGKHVLDTLLPRAQEPPTPAPAFDSRPCARCGLSAFDHGRARHAYEPQE